jgi:hypothetical protein
MSVMLPTRPLPFAFAYGSRLERRLSGCAGGGDGFPLSCSAGAAHSAVRHAGTSGPSGVDAQAPIA